MAKLTNQEIASFNAVEAAKITQIKGLSVSQILQGICDSASLGSKEHIIPIGMHVSDEIIKNLMRKGFLITYGERFNSQYLIISWQINNEIQAPNNIDYEELKELRRKNEELEILLKTERLNKNIDFDNVISKRENSLKIAKRNSLTDGPTNSEY